MTGRAVDLSKVPFKVNDWDNYSVEEAVRTVEKTGGAVTAISLGDAESDEVLRSAIAMGAKDGFLIETEQVIHDPHARAALICTFLKKEAVPMTPSLPASSPRTTSLRPWAAYSPPSWACPMRRW